MSPLPSDTQVLVLMTSTVLLARGSVCAVAFIFLLS